MDYYADGKAPAVGPQDGIGYAWYGRQDSNGPVNLEREKELSGEYLFAQWRDS